MSPLQRCRADSHCIGDLVCLYAHKLPSDLLYISPAHPQALTCSKPRPIPVLDSAQFYPVPHCRTSNTASRVAEHQTAGEGATHSTSSFTLLAQDALPMDILALNFTVDTNLSIVEDYLRNGLGEQFEVDL